MTGEQRADTAGPGDVPAGCGPGDVPAGCGAGGGPAAVPAAHAGADPEERLGRLLDEIADRQNRREERVLLAPDGSGWPPGQRGLDALAAAMRRTAGRS